MKFIPIAIIAAAVTSAGCSTDHAATPSESSSASASGLLLDHFDRKVKPQDDFYRFVNGKWLEATEIPADKSNYGMFTMLEDLSEQRLRAIVEDSARTESPTGSDAQRVGDFYKSFMDEDRVETLGIKPLANELARIATIRTPRDLSIAFGRMQRIGVAQPFVLFVNIDKKNSAGYIAYGYQRGLTMPDRDYYLSSDEKMRTARAQFLEYVRDLMSAAGEQDADAISKRILALESRLAQAQWTKVQNRDAEKTYNKFSVGEAQKRMSNLDWRAFLEGAAAHKVDNIVISQPSFFDVVDTVVRDVPLAQWREYLRFQVLDTYAPFLNKQLADRHFEFHDRVITGVAEQRPRWKRGVDAVESNIGDLAGKLYVERHFSPAAKERVAKLVGNLQRAFAKGIDQLEWMSEPTKAQAHAKLDKFTAKIGYPDKWRDWSALEVRSDDLVGNVMRATTVVFDRDIAKLGTPVDPTEWLMTPQTVNAYYNPPANEIVFPAAILQPPFFDPAADDAVNYGGIGSVIGHEISHGFDDEGRHYDGDGNLNNWWNETDDKEFRARTARLVKQYSAYTPLPGLNLNGELTLGENIADLSGVAIAYRAYLLSLDGKKSRVIDGFTGEQRFFIGYAQVWPRKYREDEMRRRLLVDPHSPNEYRVNGIVANIPEFDTAFSVKPTDKMFVDPKARVKIW